MRLICASCSEVASTARLNVCSTHPRSGSHLAIVTSGSVGPRPMHHQHYFCERVVVVLSGSIYYYREPQPPTVGRTFENPDRAKVCTTHYQEPMSPGVLLGHPLASPTFTVPTSVRLLGFPDGWQLRVQDSSTASSCPQSRACTRYANRQVCRTGRRTELQERLRVVFLGNGAAAWHAGRPKGCPLSDKVTLVASSSLSAAKGSHRTWALPIRTFPQLSSPSTISQGRLHLLPWQTPVPRGGYMSTPHNWRRTCE